MSIHKLSNPELRPYATSFPGLSLSMMLMSKSKNTLETSLDLTPLFKTVGLVLNGDYL